jgi:hypothetical protein
VIDAMTLAEAGEIFAYWERNPPAHLMVQTIARFLGWSPPAPATSIADLAAAPPPGLAIDRGGHLGVPSPLLDPTVLRARNRTRAVEIARRNQTLSRTAGAVGEAAYRRARHQPLTPALSPQWAFSLAAQR